MKTATVQSQNKLAEKAMTGAQIVWNVLEREGVKTVFGYPGGAVIDRLARGGDATAIAFPRAMMASEHGADFSFSGLKTSLLHHVRAHGVPDGQAEGTERSVSAETSSRSVLCPRHVRTLTPRPAPHADRLPQRATEYDRIGCNPARKLR